MTEEKARRLAEAAVAVVPTSHFTITVSGVRVINDLVTVTLATDAKTFGDFDVRTYYEQLESHAQQNSYDPEVMFMFTGIQPESEKSRLRRDPDKKR